MFRFQFKISRYHNLRKLLLSTNHFSFYTNKNFIFNLIWIIFMGELFFVKLTFSENESYSQLNLFIAPETACKYTKFHEKSWSRFRDRYILSRNTYDNIQELLIQRYIIIQQRKFKSLNVIHIIFSVLINPPIERREVNFVRRPALRREPPQSPILTGSLFIPFL